MNDSISNINALGFIFATVMSIMLFVLPRRFAILPIFMTATYVTLGQVVLIGPFNFSIIRIIILVGWFRAFTKNEFNAIKLNSIDKVQIAYFITSSIIYFILRKDSNALINSTGFLYNALGLYFLFRAIIRDERDYDLIFKMLAYVMFPLALSMMVEKLTRSNLFSVFGGVPEFTEIRDGRLRCQGAFAHPILSGMFGATSLPFFISLWVKGNVYKFSACVGICSATIITITSASSGPLMVYFAVIIGLFMWYLKENMRMVRWAILIMLIALHMFMKAPVWALIGKVSEVIGGGGWHRVMLIDAAVSHFNEWWMLGTDYTRHWLPTGVTWAEKHTDITNHFIGIGIRGGLISLLLFVVSLVYCFKAIGIRMEEMESGQSKLKFSVWCLGVSLFAHINAFISVSYFDQIIVFFYLLIALIAALNINEKETRTKEGSSMLMKIKDHY